MKAFLFITALSLSPAYAQFGWVDEPASDSVLDQFNTALRAPVIEPIRPIEPVVEPISVGREATRLRSQISGLRPPAVPAFQPFVASVVDMDPLVEQCDLEPEVAQVYRASGIDDSTRDPLPATAATRPVPRISEGSARILTPPTPRRIPTVRRAARTPEHFVLGVDPAYGTRRAT